MMEMRWSIRRDASLHRESWYCWEGGGEGRGERGSGEGRGGPPGLCRRKLLQGTRAHFPMSKEGTLVSLFDWTATLHKGQARPTPAHPLTFVAPSFYSFCSFCGFFMLIRAIGAHLAHPAHLTWPPGRAMPQILLTYTTGRLSLFPLFAARFDSSLARTIPRLRWQSLKPLAFHARHSFQTSKHYE